MRTCNSSKGFVLPTSVHIRLNIQIREQQRKVLIQIRFGIRAKNDNLQNQTTKNQKTLSAYKH